ncbi:MAG: hypothetical protein IT379_40310 [Deltaproteobacteria bacterium]|nr:hypothetical protein [Deltaproteobacteria bacterium]
MDRHTFIEMLGALPTAKASGTAWTFEKGRAIVLHVGSSDAMYAIRDVERIDVKDRFVEVAAEEGKVFLVPIEELRWLSARPAAAKAKAGFGT